MSAEERLTISVRCPTCEASAGQPCRIPASFHGSRFDAARGRKGQEPTPFCSLCQTHHRSGSFCATGSYSYQNQTCRCGKHQRMEDCAACLNN